MSSITCSPKTERSLVKASVIAQHFNITPATVYRWASEKRIDSWKFQNTVRFDLDAVRAAFNAQSSPPPCTPPAQNLPPDLEEQIEALRSRYFEEQAAMLEEVEA
ncbi:MAG: hypothetical protein RI957_946 [Verrucomicrobiota bacterium]|jgi:hypothetical protein